MTETLNGVVGHCFNNGIDSNAVHNSDSPGGQSSEPAQVDTLTTAYRLANGQTTEERLSSVPTTEQQLFDSQTTEESLSGLDQAKAEVRMIGNFIRDEGLNVS